MITHAFIDLEGTLVQNSILQYLIEKLDKRKLSIYLQLEKLLHESKNREYIADEFRLLEGFHEQEIKEKVYYAPFRPGVKEGIKLLRDNGIYTVLLTDLPDVICEKIKELFGFDDFICSETIRENGKIIGFKRFNLYKEKAFLQYISEKGIDPKKCVHIGDWLNDIEIFKVVRYGIAFNPSVPEVAYHASFTININDFTFVAKLILRL